MGSAAIMIVSGRFRLDEKLGEGGMAIVWRATDLESGREVALKVMKAAMDREARRRFLREFSTLVSLRHPHCVRVFEYGETHEGPYFTMELFSGRPISSLIGEEPAVVLDALRQAALALEFVHSRRLAHRDVKPSNLLVLPVELATPGEIPHDAPADRRYVVKLTDFGLAKFHASSSSVSANAGFLGTLEYCAPEQISGADLDQRADLYSLALVAYELVTGRHPYAAARGVSIPALMQAHLHESPAPMRSFAPHTPAPLERAVFAYLSKDPASRPRSTALLRMAIAESLGETGDGIIAAVEMETAAPVAAQTLVGRDRQIEALGGFLSDLFAPPKQMAAGGAASANSFLANTGPAIAVLVGDSGSGKTSLLREAARLACASGAHVYEGRCFEGNLAPFQPFAEILRQLLLEQQLRLAYPAADGSPASQVASLIDRHRTALLRIAPDLRKWLPGDTEGDAPIDLERAATFFRELGERQLTCLGIDDIQWADQGAWALLCRLAERAADDGPPSRLAIVCTAPPTDSAEPMLRELERRGAVLMPVSPLDPEESLALIALRLGCRDEEVSSPLAHAAGRQSRGNPFLLCETIRQWRRDDVLEWKEQAWTLSLKNPATASYSEAIRQALRARLSGLSSNARQVAAFASAIEAGAFAFAGIENGGALSDAIMTLDASLLAAADIPAAELLCAVEELLRRGVLCEEQNERMEFAHPLLAELTLHDVSTSRRAVLHRRLMQTLEERRQTATTCGVDIPFTTLVRLAGHCRAAGLADKALAYSLEAAEAALEARSPAVAIACLNDVKGALLLSATTDRVRWSRLLGRAHAQAGSFAEARAAYESALSFAEQPALRAGVQRELAEVHRRSEQYDQAVECLETALRELGFAPSRSFVAAAWRRLVCRVRIAFRLSSSRIARSEGAAEESHAIKEALGALGQLHLEHAEAALGPNWVAGDKTAAELALTILRRADLLTFDLAPGVETESPRRLRLHGRAAFSAGRRRRARRLFLAASRRIKTNASESEAAMILLDLAAVFPDETPPRGANVK